MVQAKVFCPASLSFIFKYCYNKDRNKMGSIGIGCTLDKGVTVIIEKASHTTILYNGKSIQFPTVNSVISSLAPYSLFINIKSPLPLGYGFGLSGACALACAFAINALYNLGKSREDLIKIAHICELKNHTGLGSVGTQTTGGFLIKTTPGIPFKFTSLPFIGKKLYAVLVDKLLTPKILKDKKYLERIGKSADKALVKIKKINNSSLADVLDISFEYLKESSLLTNKKVISIINHIKKSGGHATMAILGQVVISDRKPESDNGLIVEELSITSDRVHLI